MDEAAERAWDHRFAVDVLGSLMGGKSGFIVVDVFQLLLNSGKFLAIAGAVV